MSNTSVKVALVFFCWSLLATTSFAQGRGAEAGKAAAQLQWDM